MNIKFRTEGCFKNCAHYLFVWLFVCLSVCFFLCLFLCLFVYFIGLFGWIFCFCFLFFFYKHSFFSHHMAHPLKQHQWLEQGFSIILLCGPQMVEASSKIYVWGPNDHHCPMYFYVYWSWQRTKQVWYAGRIWPTGRHLRRPGLESK